MKTASALALAVLVLAGLAGGAAAQQNTVKPTPDSIARGKAIFQQNCSTCHGNEGKGDGPAAVALNPKPANLAVGQFKYGGTDAAVFKTITQGVPGTAMVGWASLPEQDRWHIVNYVKSLSGKGGQKK